MTAMRAVTRLLVLAVLMTLSCGQKQNPNSDTGQAICYELGVAAQIGITIRERVAGQYASTDKAMGLWDKWEKKQVSPEQDGAGEYSGAGQRAFAYERTGRALCESARLVDAGMLMMASDAKLDVTTAQGRFAQVTCALKASPKSSDMTIRNAAAQESAEQSRLAREGEDALVNACTARAGITRPAIQLPPMLVLQE
jgi:hypothetical protein